jgi:hypothetical protein
LSPRTWCKQAIDSAGMSWESLITNKVIAISPDTPGKPISYAMRVPLTAESRLKTYNEEHSLVFLNVIKDTFL